MTLEEAQEIILQLKEQMETVQADNQQTKIALEEAQKRQQELQEHNQKLFLRVTSKVNTDEEKETDDEKEISEYIGQDIFKELNNKEKKLLDEIIKGEDE